MVQSKKYIISPGRIAAAGSGSSRRIDKAKTDLYSVVYGSHDAFIEMTYALAKPTLVECANLFK